MPFYAPGGLKVYILALLQEGKEFEDSLPPEYPHNLKTPEEIKVVYAAINQRRNEVQDLYTYIARIESAHREGRNIVSLTEWMIAVKKYQGSPGIP
jgi:hypothetical protein